MGNKSAVKERKRETAIVVEVGACRHHWLIESPHGALSDGRCKLCGEERQFRNSTSDYIWDDDSSSRYGSLGGVRSRPKPAVQDDDTVAATGSGRGEVALVL